MGSIAKYNARAAPWDFSVSKAKTAKRSAYMTSYSQIQKLQRELQSGGFGKNHAKYIAKLINKMEGNISDGLGIDLPDEVLVDPAPDSFESSQVCLWQASDEFAVSLAGASQQEAVQAKVETIQKACEETPAWHGAFGQIEGVFVHDLAGKFVPNLDDSEGSELRLFGAKRACKRSDWPSKHSPIGLALRRQCLAEKN